MQPTKELVPGAHYAVKIKGHRTDRRIFKWAEQRFGDIPCFVFTAPVTSAVKAEWNEAESSLTITGPRVPRSEVSVPHYDLESAVEAA